MSPSNVRSYHAHDIAAARVRGNAWSSARSAHTDSFSSRALPRSLSSKEPPFDAAAFRVQTVCDQQEISIVLPPFLRFSFCTSSARALLSLFSALFARVRTLFVICSRLTYVYAARRCFATTPFAVVRRAPRRARHPSCPIEPGAVCSPSPPFSHTRSVSAFD